MAEEKLSPDDAQQGSDPGLTPGRGTCCVRGEGYQPPKIQGGLSQRAGAFAQGAASAPNIES